MTFVSTGDGSLLRSVRQALAGADEILICVAYMKESGVRLLENEFRAASERAVVPRVLVTTALGTTDARALDLAHRLGLDTRIYNPGRGTFHPKLYLARHGQRSRAFIGSANMTSGLAGNIEVGLVFDGAMSTGVLSSAWEWANARWDEPVVEYWDPTSRPAIPAEERFDPVLLPLLRALRGRTYRTLAKRKPNTIAEVEDDGIIVRTDRSPQGQRVPAWMFNIAWSYLTTHGRLSNQHLCDELRVKRSAAVVAVLAQLPSVRVADERSATIEFVVG